MFALSAKLEIYKIFAPIFKWNSWNMTLGWWRHLLMLRWMGCTVRKVPSVWYEKINGRNSNGPNFCFLKENDPIKSWVKLHNRHKNPVFSESGVFELRTYENHIFCSESVRKIRWHMQMKLPVFRTNNPFASMLNMTGVCLGKPEICINFSKKLVTFNFLRNSPFRKTEHEQYCLTLRIKTTLKSFYY